MKDKLQQVMEEHFKPEYYNAHHLESALYGAKVALDVIIEEIAEDPIYLAKPEDTFEKGFNCGVEHALLILKEARSELLQQQ